MSSMGSGPAKLYSRGRKHSFGNPQPTSSSLSWFLASQVTRMACMFSPLWSQKFASPRSPPCRAFSQHCAMKESFLSLLSLTEYETWGAAVFADSGCFSSPDPDFFPTRVSQISDPTATKRGEKFICCIPFCSKKFYKIESYLVFGTGTENDSSQLTINSSILKILPIFFSKGGFFYFFSVLFYKALRSS
jgi:hypothetical protein